MSSTGLDGGLVIGAFDVGFVPCEFEGIVVVGPAVESGLDAPAGDAV